MRFLIATGIYPPDIGGPAKYAKALEDALKLRGNSVKVAAYRLEKKLPFGVRQIFYMARIFFAAFGADAIIALDTVSVGFPAVAVSFLTGKKVAIRTGGDFLWESYLERTGYEIPLPAFYKIMPPLSYKEKVILKIHQFVLDYTNYIVFSTAWQRDIWSGFYTISPEKIKIIENCYPPKKSAESPGKKVFLASARNIVMKNLDNIKEAFDRAKETAPEIELDTAPYSPEVFEEKLRSCYAAVVVSHGDISPNTIIEAISFGKPFILTKYNGIKNRLSGAGIIVDPLDVKAIAKAFIDLSNEKRYQEEAEKVGKIDFLHSYADIAAEFISLFSK